MGRGCRLGLSLKLYCWAGKFDVNFMFGVKMLIVEDFVKEAMEAWLKAQGYLEVKARLGTRQGYDIEGKHPISSKCLVIECKGEAKTGSQHHRSWTNVASAILTTLNETEDVNNTNDVGLAFPDTKEYRGRMNALQAFCKRQNILVYWVNESGQVTQW